MLSAAAAGYGLYRQTVELEPGVREVQVAVGAAFLAAGLHVQTAFLVGFTPHVATLAWVLPLRVVHAPLYREAAENEPCKVCPPSVGITGTKKLRTGNAPVSRKGGDGRAGGPGRGALPRGLRPLAEPGGHFRVRIRIPTGFVSACRSLVR